MACQQGVEGPTGIRYARDWGAVRTCAGDLEVCLAGIVP